MSRAAAWTVGIFMLESLCLSSGVYVFFTSKSPFFIVLSVILLSFSLGLIMLMGLNSWMFYSMVVMFLGGMMVAFSYSSSVNTHFKPLLFNKLDMLCMVLMFLVSGYTFSVLRVWSTKSLHSYNMYSDYMAPSLVVMVMVIILSLSILMKVLPSHEGPLKMAN